MLRGLFLSLSLHRGIIMKDTTTMGRAAIVAALALAAAPAFAADGHYGAFHHWRQGQPATDRSMRDDGSIHWGAGNPSDQALADAVADAFRNDPALFGATATIVANNGRVSLAGSSKSLQQSARAETVARHVAGVMSVSGTLDPMGG